MREIYGLTLWQPWASCIAEGWKPIENRNWPLPVFAQGKYVAIHAGKTFDDDAAEYIRTELEYPLIPDKEVPMGVILAVGRLVGCIAGTEVPEPSRGEDWDKQGGSFIWMWRVDDQVKLTDIEVKEWFNGTYGFIIRDVVKLPSPVPAKGMQKFWSLPWDVLGAVRQGYVAVKE